MMLFSSVYIGNDFERNDLNNWILTDKLAYLGYHILMFFHQMS